VPLGYIPSSSTMTSLTTDIDATFRAVLLLSPSGPGVRAWRIAPGVRLRCSEKTPPTGRVRPDREAPGRAQEAQIELGWVCTFTSRGQPK
jgi:hypothetical protein